ncbi:glycosyltransferase family 9 protein [Pseudodesulfovibrio sp.]|uniref:glycosyltransferase family 9 protein n=1 Tax=unclassified Pseudodesulfovibrio TaxID=2661612 RepID=UPI003B00885F
MLHIDKDRIRTILLLRMDRIGDMFCTTPALRALRRAYPDARIDMVAAPGNAAVVRNNPDIDSLAVFPLKKPWLWPLHYLKYRLRRYDMVVAFNGQSRTTARLAKFVHARHCVGTWARATENYFKETVRYQQGEHTIEFMLRTAGELGGTELDPAMVFPVADAVRERMAERFPRRQGKRRVAMFIGNAKKVDTRWPEDRFAELSKRLTARGDVEIYVVAGPGDEGLLPPFSWTDDCLRYPGGSLEELAAFLGTCDLFVTSSSGPMHLAAAVDAPMVAILADYTYMCWRPLADIHTIVQSHQPDVQVGTVTVDEVLEAVEYRLDVIE